MDVESSIKLYQQLFCTVIWPGLQPKIGGNIVSAEASDDKVRKTLDLEMSIDLLHSLDNGVRLVANRINMEFWETFTVRIGKGYRSNSEWSKINRALEYGFGCPTHSYQSIIIDNTWKCTGIIRTPILFQAIHKEINKNHDYIETMPNSSIVTKFGDSGHRFFAIPWSMPGIREHVQVFHP